ncbi:MAG: alpha/beta fold hydrolase [Flavobacteriales bacterium]
MIDLVLLHGAIGSAEQTKILQEIPQNKFRLHHIELSGHGKKSSVDVNFSMDAFVDEVEKYFNDNKLTDVNFFGYSMGGYVGLLHAVKYSGRIARLMTLGTKFYWTPEVAAKEVSMLDSEKIKEKVPAFAAQLEAQHGANWSDVLRRTTALMKNLGENNPIDALDLGAVKIPVKLLLAQYDHMVTPKETLEIYKRLNNVGFQRLANSKHPLEQVDIDALGEEIIQWFAYQ